MQLGPFSAIECPHCGMRYSKMDIKSRNTLGAKLWTDEKTEAPVEELLNKVR